MSDRHHVYNQQPQPTNLDWDVFRFRRHLWYHYDIRPVGKYACWFDAIKLGESWGDWDFDTISNYYQIDPEDPLQYGTHFPLPAHLIRQWQQKINLTKGEMPTKMSYLYHKQKNHEALLMTEKSLDARMLASWTIQSSTYFPFVVTVRPGSGPVHIPAWVDQFSYFSNVMVSSLPRDKAYLESQALVIPSVENSISYHSFVQIYILQSHYTVMDERSRVTDVTPIVWPDPISWESVLQAAKNYLLYPAMAAGAGYLTGGLPGAVVGGASQVIGQATKDLTTSPGKADDVAKVVREVAAKIPSSQLR